MDSDPAFIETTKQSFIRIVGDNFGEGNRSSDFWEACEALTSPDINTRRLGLDSIVTLDAAYKSPLVAYILASRIIEPDLALRARIVKILADILSPNQQIILASTQVRVHLMAYLAQMRTRPIFALLQVSEHEPSIESGVAQLLNSCPHGGGRLGDILTNRQLSLSIRKQAARLIGLVGYMEALPALEKVAVRLEARSNGNGNGYSVYEADDELSLLPHVLEALDRLRAP